MLTIWQRVLGFLLTIIAWIFVMLIILAPHTFGQSNGASLFPAIPQFLDNSGFPLTNGWICSYQSGNTTPQSTYTSATAGTPNADPLQLDASGRGYAWLAAGLTYRIAIYAAGSGNTCNGQAVGTLIKQLDGVALPAPPTYGFISGTGSIVQLASSVKIAWGASGTNPWIYGDGTNLNFVGSSGSTQFKNGANNAVNMSITDTGFVTTRSYLRVGTTTGPLLSPGTPTIGSCSTGSITSGSSDFAGEATATGATSCTINFSVGFSAQPFCVANDETTVAALRISAISTSAFTVTNLTSNDKFMWVCVAR
jgi:hypothetical protein